MRTAIDTKRISKMGGGGANQVDQGGNIPSLHVRNVLNLGTRAGERHLAVSGQLILT